MKKRLYQELYLHPYFNFDVFVVSSMAISRVLAFKGCSVIDQRFTNDSRYNKGYWFSIPLSKNITIEPVVGNEYYTINIIRYYKPDYISVRLHKGTVTSINDEYVIMDHEFFIPKELVNDTNENNIKKYVHRYSLFYSSPKTAIPDLLSIKTNTLPQFKMVLWQSNW